MIHKTILVLMQILLRLIDEDTLKKAVDALLDVIEDKVNESKTQIDNITVLPLCKLIRNTFNIPDNDLPKK